MNVFFREKLKLKLKLELINYPTKTYYKNIYLISINVVETLLPPSIVFNSQNPFDHLIAKNYLLSDF